MTSQKSVTQSFLSHVGEERLCDEPKERLRRRLSSYPSPPGDGKRRDPRNEVEFWCVRDGP